MDQIRFRMKLRPHPVRERHPDLLHGLRDLLLRVGEKEGRRGKRRRKGEGVFFLKQCTIRLLLLMMLLWWFGAVGSDVGRINEVTLRRTRLVLGWVTISGFNSRCGQFISV